MTNGNTRPGLHCGCNRDCTATVRHWSSFHQSWAPGTRRWNYSLIQISFCEQEDIIREEIWDLSVPDEVWAFLLLSGYPVCELVALVVGSPDGIKQRSANDSSQAKSVPQSVSVNKVLLKHSYNHSLTQCLWVFCTIMAEFSSCNRDLRACTIYNSFCLVLYRKVCRPPGVRLKWD